MRVASSEFKSGKPLSLHIGTIMDISVIAHNQLPVINNSCWKLFSPSFRTDRSLLSFLQGGLSSAARYKVLKHVNERHTFLVPDLDYTSASSFHQRIEIRWKTKIEKLFVTRYRKIYYPVYDNPMTLVSHTFNICHLRNTTQLMAILWKIWYYYCRREVAYFIIKINWHEYFLITHYILTFTNLIILSWKDPKANLIAISLSKKESSWNPTESTI